MIVCPDKFFLKVSEGLATCKKLKDAQHLKFNSKSARSRVVDSPTMTLQSVVIERSFSIACNVHRLSAVVVFSVRQPGTEAN
jgi:hypothetical protein